jgi:hypothetical protein
MMDIEPTDEERRAIASLRRLARRWPESLWLFSASGNLMVMRARQDGSHAKLSNNGVDPDYILGQIYGIPNDGGDW